MPRRSTRRKFLATTAATGAAALTTTDVASAAQVVDRPPLVQMLTDVVRHRFGKHLTEGNLKAVEESIAGDLLSAEALKRIRLENGDEPAFLFVPEVE